jgi:hypothetical protein
LARIILSHALLESIRFVMSRKECRDIYGLINTDMRRWPTAICGPAGPEIKSRSITNTQSQTLSARLRHRPPGSRQSSTDAAGADNR